MSLSQFMLSAKRRQWNNKGSVLIYVLWILVIISILAFKLGAASNVMSVKKSSLNHQLKHQMQIDSAIQFSIFKIMVKQWKDEKFYFDLNQQGISIRIHNESGYISLYKMSHESLIKISERLRMDLPDVENFIRTIGKDNKKFNSYYELIDYYRLNQSSIEEIKPYISIYHEEPVNPSLAPIEVLSILPGIDLYRVEKLARLRDSGEKASLRKEIVNQFNKTGADDSDYLSPYYRIQVAFDHKSYRVIVKFNKRLNQFKVVLIEPVLKQAEYADA